MGVDGRDGERRKWGRAVRGIRRGRGRGKGGE